MLRQTVLCLLAAALMIAQGASMIPRHLPAGIPGSVTAFPDTAPAGYGEHGAASSFANPDSAPADEIVHTDGGDLGDTQIREVSSAPSQSDATSWQEHEARYF